MSENSTIFDDVFRTMVEKLSYLTIPLINEVFYTAYPPDIPITQLRNEHQKGDGEIITDSCLLIADKLYHLECQSSDDSTMAIRMIEYDFAVAVENAVKQGRRYRIELPRSCVLYLRCTENTPDFLETEIVFPGEGTMLHNVPAIKLKNYTADLIFEKKLLLLLPFYIMRYEKEAHKEKRDSILFQELMREYEEIRFKLETETNIMGKTSLYTDLKNLITRIADYILQNDQELKKGIGDIMGGKVLELESERLMAIGEKRGIAIGEARGKECGIAIGEARGEERGVARGFALGEEHGLATGETRGEERLSILINRLILDGRSDEIQSVVTNAEKRRQLYAEFDL